MVDEHLESGEVMVGQPCQGVPVLGRLARDDALDVLKGPHLEKL